MMKYPDFQDFLHTLTPEKMGGIFVDAKQKCEQTAAFDSGGQIISMSWTISLELLALYHIWVEEYLQDL